MARSLTAASQLISDARLLLGIRDNLYPNDKECLRFLNYSVFTLSNLLDGLYEPWERKADVVGTNPIHADFAPFTGTYDSSTRIFTSPHNLSDIIGSGHTVIGGLLGIYEVSTKKSGVGIIESLPSTTTILLRMNATLSTSGSCVAIFVAYPWYTAGINDPPLTPRNIKKILTVEDSVSGNAMKLGAHEFESFPNDNGMNSIAIWDFGDGIYVKKGENITAFGNLTLHYNAHPNVVNSITSFLDLEPEHHDMIVKDVARQVEASYPELGKRKDQSDPFATLRRLYDTAENAFMRKQMSYEIPGRNM